MSRTPLPPGTSKWNKIEHRMFCHITRNWRGNPLESLAVIVDLTVHTTTAKGLKIRAGIDASSYPKGKTVSDEVMQRVQLNQMHFTVNGTTQFCRDLRRSCSHYSG